MTAASASHRLLNLLQSTLLLGLMAALAWVSVSVILGPGTGLLVALGMVAGVFLAVNRHPNGPPDRRPKVTPLARG
ncbi:hypothetical protein [Paracoccus limosus]|uniref:hypothetical protein n=1 Tax=Paracoccus limosus TaxID=913252 RepID=UPI001B866990|nr:hypothetical protein [Paracoccus limosus]